MTQPTSPDPRPRRAFSANERREIEDMIRRIVGLSSPGGPPSGAAGGDLSGTYPNPSVVDDSHNHTAPTLPATIVYDGDAAGGDLAGTYPNPSVQDDSHAHTAGTLPSTIVYDGDAAGGDLYGTYPNPSVVDDSHAHTSATVTGPFPPSGAAGGALDGTYPNPGLAASVAGAGLAESSDVLSVNVDTTSIEINADTLRRTALTGDATAAAGSSAVTVVQASGAFALPGDIAVSALTGNQDDWAPTGIANASRINIDVNASATIRGISGGADGRILVLHHLRSSTGGLDIAHENTNSTAANRISIPKNNLATGTDMFLGIGESVILQYNAVISRWTVIGYSGNQPHSASHMVGGYDELVPNSITNAKLDQMPGLSVKGNPGSLTDDADDIVAAVSGHVLRRLVSGLAFGTLDFTSITDQASQVVVGRGDAGTGDLAACTLDTGISITTGELFKVAGRAFALQVINQGTTTYTPGTGCTMALILGVAAGGGGGGAAQTSSQAAGASGGGGGGWWLKFLTGVTGTYTVSVGAKGTGGAAGNNNGNAGNDTTFTNGGTTYTAKGGAGGTGMAAGTAAAYAQPGVGGAVSTNADVNAGGMPGQYGKRDSGTLASGGPGGSSIMGGAGAARVAEGGGLDGKGFGAGGGGAVCTGTTARAGGDGTDGVIIVLEFY